MNRFFKIPAGYIIAPATRAEDYYVSTDRVESWERDVVNEQNIVRIFGVDEAQLVLDGEWSQQLESCVGGCNGGVDPAPGGGGEVRVAYGGIFQPDPINYTEIIFPQPGEWVTLNNSVLQMLPYEQDGTDEFVYNLEENSATLTWMDPVPTSRQFGQITVIWSVAAVGNDQIYEFGLLFDDTDITSPSGRAILSFERAGDVETLVQQGHGTVQNGTKVQVAVRNREGTNPLRLYTVNMRITVSAQNEPIINIPT